MKCECLDGLYIYQTRVKNIEKMQFHRKSKAVFYKTYQLVSITKPASTKMASSRCIALIQGLVVGFDTDDSAQHGII